MLESCPKCGSKRIPKSEWDHYDNCLSCMNCGYYTGFHHIPSATEIWNKDYSDFKTIKEK